MHSDFNEPILFKLGMVIDRTERYLLKFGLYDFDYDSRSQGCKKAKTSAPDSYIKLNGIWYAVENSLSDEHHTHFYLVLFIVRVKKILLM